MKSRIWYSLFLSLLMLDAVGSDNSLLATKENSTFEESHLFSSLPQSTVTGIVKNKTNNPLEGVTVSVKNTSIASSTDAQGRFKLEGVSSNATLIFRSIGYQESEIDVAGRTVVNVELSEDLTSLEELVVIGYGTVSKTDLTGSVARVDMGDLSKAPVGSFAQALGGRVAGVQVTANDGQPGGGMNILVRGAGSLTQNTSPLYVVDGFPIENLDPSTLNTADIESISILKDASSTAVYGSRAANGVVLIQTKRGFVGASTVNISSSLGLQSRPKKIPLMTPYEFLQYQVELNPNSPLTHSYFQDGLTIDDYRNVPGIDWQDQVFRTGAVQIHDLAIRGGTEKTKYSISGNIFDQKGAVINTGYGRYSGRVTLDHEISERIKMGVTANYTGVRTNGFVVNSSYVANNPTSTIMMRTWMYRPISSLTDDRNLLDEPADDDAVTNSDFRMNPVIDLENQHHYNFTNLLDANGYVSYEITDGLVFKSMAGIRHDIVKQDRYFNSNTSQGNPTNPNNLNGVFGTVLNIYTNSYVNENTLTYQKTFNDDHNITALALFGANALNTNRNGFTGRELPNENLIMDGIDQGTPINPAYSSSRNTMLSYATRFDYNYQSKYLLTLTFRADGSSKFIENPWGYFPGAAVGWNIGKEDFFNSAFPFVSSSKIRASYGSTGNNRVGDFAPHPNLSQNINGYSFNDATPTSMAFISSVGNSGLRWEKINTLDVGYELGLWDNRVSFEFDMYRRTTVDMLLQAEIPRSTGFTSAQKNIGSLKNEGLEFTLNTVNVERPDFSWHSGFNISFNRNTIIALNEGQQALYTNGRYFSQFNRPLYISELNQPAGMMMGLVWEGNYQYEHFHNPAPGVYVLRNDVPTNGAARNSIQPGDIKYRDINGDGIINDLDLTIIGRGQPIHSGGFVNNFRYKGFSLNVFFQWAYGNNIYNANRLAMEGNSNGLALVNQFASYVNRWTPDNQTNDNYRTRGQGPIGNYSSKVVEDGSFLRLKTLSLDYSLPSAWIRRAYLNDLTLTLAAQNLLTWTNYTGLDPEVSILNSVTAPGFDFSGYPTVRTVTFGVRLGF